jgi:type II secretion system protein H
MSLRGLARLLDDPLSRKGSGMTLIEVMLVVLLLGVVTAIAVPNLRHAFTGTRLARAVDDVANQMRWVQTQALLKGQPFQVHWRSGEQTFHVQKWDTETSRFVDWEHRNLRPVEMPWLTDLRYDASVVDVAADGQFSGFTWMGCDGAERCQTLTTRYQRGMVSVAEGIMEEWFVHHAD